MSSDMKGIAGSMLLLCLLCLMGFTNANRSPTINKYVYQVCEDTPKGDPAFTIEASDPEGDVLTYALTGVNAGYFKVNPSTGLVTVASPLDREGGDGSGFMTLGVEVSDPATKTTGEINVILNDANDNPPLFNQSSYDVTIPENTAVGETLFKVTATDRDSSTAGSVKYSIDAVTPAAGFSLFTISTVGEVKLNGSLNYTSLSTYYQLRINATDGGGKCHFPDTTFLSSTVFSIVTVKDVPDLDPVFIGLPYIGQVDEHSAVGQSVFKVTAVDQDVEVNDKIIYSIEDATEDGLFTVSADGVISVAAEIDRETIGDIVTLTVKATESQQSIFGYYANTTATVQININDINDKEPKFYKCEDPENMTSCVEASDFTGETPEHSTATITINMTVEDLDKNPRTKLSIEGNGSDVFFVVPTLAISKSNVELQVINPQELDFETSQQMILHVIAEDQENPSFTSTATVTVIITDTNDMSPVFPNSTYKLTVPEHSPEGTSIETITAEDPDTMDQNNIKYSLLPESILPYFDVGPSDGTIYVKNHVLLDREVRSLFTATLQATDTSNKVGTTLLEITVTDINDNAPEFSRESYLQFVQEGKSFELQIQATDADEPNTPNSQIVYEIVPSNYSENFTIDPGTGVLSSLGDLDREAIDPDLDGEIELTIKATDEGDPPLSSTVTVIIEIEDVNDNEPQFENSSYTFSVKEGEKGAKVGSVYAEDLDQTEYFNRISFSIISGSFGSFIIRTSPDEGGYRGDITVDPDVELDYESTLKQFVMVVEATDLGGRTADVTVEVNVLDVNDERPAFYPTESVTVKENTTITGIIGSFTGYDKDGNHSLIYELESMTCRCKGIMTNCNSFILDPTGSVRVNPEYTLDYEQCDQAIIEAQVVDVFTEKGENNSVETGQMVIYIEDVNDNAPEFISSDSIFVVVSESASAGTSVAAVSATDLDSGINRQIEFQVTSVQFVDNNDVTTDMRMLFRVVTTQQNDIYVGIIQTTEKLDMTLKGKYLVTVSANDSGGLSTDTVLEIFTIDESHRVELEFTRAISEVEANLDAITRALTAATITNVVIVAVRSDNSAISRETAPTFIDAYFVYSNGTALTPVKVGEMLSEPEHYLALTKLGLKNVGTDQQPTEEPPLLSYILLGVLGGLIIVLLVLTTSLICTRRNYSRKLKAAKAKNSMGMYDNQNIGPVVPGTNKYTTEGANPVLNLNIDTIMDVDVDGSDVDKVSLYSLDGDNDTYSSKKEAESFESDSKPPVYIEPLDEALAHRGGKKSGGNPRTGKINPMFNTEEL